MLIIVLITNIIILNIKKYNFKEYKIIYIVYNIV